MTVFHYDSISNAFTLQASMHGTFANKCTDKWKKGKVRLRERENVYMMHDQEENRKNHNLTEYIYVYLNSLFPQIIKRAVQTDKWINDQNAVKSTLKNKKII